MLPVSLLSWSRRPCSLERSNSSAGIGPVRAFLCSSRKSSSESPPIAGGIVPSSFLPLRKIARTRSGSRKFSHTYTPRQRLTAVETSQSSEAEPRSVSFTASKASQSATRPALLAGSGTAVPFSHPLAAVAVVPLGMIPT